LTGPGSSEVERVIRIRARPETVWRYWTDPERICAWWGESAELDPRPGGICRVNLGGNAVMTGEYLELIPYHRIVFTFGWEPVAGAPPVLPGSSTVTITLAADGDDTVMTLRHTVLPPAAQGQTLAGWSRFLPLLATAAAASAGPRKESP
jgi:uncharacterized protein YndB with AHSA1/START domain